MSIANPEHCPNCGGAMESVLDYYYWHCMKCCAACKDDEE